MNKNDDILNKIYQYIDSIKFIKSEDIPNIDLYMDQVTTFMESQLRTSARNPEEDKILTKTMINNYAKNDILPPPEKKKYSREHMLLLIFIYYFKGVLSMNDVERFLAPVKERFFRTEGDYSLEQVYEEVTSLEQAQSQALKDDITDKLSAAESLFADAPAEDKEMLQTFAFLAELGFDIYRKKLLLEKLIDTLPQTHPDENDEQKEDKKAEKKEKKEEKRERKDESKKEKRE